MTIIDTVKDAREEKEITIIDTVEYVGLTPGNTYKLVTSLMNQKTDKAIQVDGKDLTVEVIFKAENASGTVDVEIKLSTKDLAGVSLVVFEKLFDAEDHLIGTHEDLNDKGQTVSIVVGPSTGDRSKMGLYSVTGLLSLALMLFLFRKKRKDRLVLAETSDVPDNQDYADEPLYERANEMVSPKKVRKSKFLKDTENRNNPKRE